MRIVGAVAIVWGMGTFQKFRAWDACFALTLEVYRVTGSWPKAEMYGLTSQARRAAVSTGANIAEGSAKRGSAEFGRFLDIVLGSLSELEHLLLVARALGFLHQEDWQSAETKRIDAARLTYALYRAVRPPRPP